jgi:hypothetical protein
MRQQKLCEIFYTDVDCACKHIYPTFPPTNLIKKYIVIECSRREPNLMQTRICSSHKCSHMLSFLSLPIYIRHQIYIKAGLVHEKNIYLHKNSNKQEDYQTTLNLLLTSQSIHQEVFAIVHSTNRFHVNFHSLKVLVPVLCLIPKAIALITKLIVVVNQTSCDSTGCCQSGTQCNGRICQNKEQYPRPFNLRYNRNALIEWTVTVRYFSIYVTPSKLALVFICDVENFETAQLTVETFFDMTKLASCQIRLARYAGFTFLTEKTAAVAIGCPSTQCAPFHFLKLPAELRIAIPRLTDLVTPDCEVEVDIHGKYRARNAILDSWPGIARYEQAIQFLYCSQDENICLCRRYHSVAPNCRCSIPPRSLFLVCKSVRELAIETFFSQNRFVIIPAGWRNSNPPPPLVFDQFPTTIFFQRAQQQNTLHFLRRIYIPLPTYRVGYQNHTELAFQDWRNTMKKMSAQNCLLGIVVTIFIGYGGVTKRIPTGSDNLYHRFCEPLIGTGIRKLYVHTVQNFPWHANGHICGN